jgi:hypothetical protein
MSFFFAEKFEPRLRPRECIQVRGKYYEVVETRPMLFFEVKRTNITSNLPVDLKDEGLKPLSNELLNYRLSIRGPVQVLVRIEGTGGPVFGGWGKLERLADERTPPHMLEFVQLGEETGWPYVEIRPMVIPAWCKLTCYGYVYVVRELPKAPAVYTTPAFVWAPSTPA